MLDDDHSFAADLAASTGRVLLSIRRGLGGPELSGEALAKAGDRGAQEHITTRLATARPDDALLSEEAPDDSSRLRSNRVWIVDPLDGTREYSEGRDDWAVHVALWERDELVAGAVALPGLNLTLGTGTSAAPRPPSHDHIRLAISRSRASDLVLAVARRVNATLVPMGSAGFKVGAVVRGEADAYIHSGGQYEWDSAAPVAVARASSLYASRLDGSTLRYNRADPYLPDLVVCRPELARNLLDAVAEVKANGR